MNTTKWTRIENRFGEIEWTSGSLRIVRKEYDMPVRSTCYRVFRGAVLLDDDVPKLAEAKKIAIDTVTDTDTKFYRAAEYLSAVEVDDGYAYYAAETSHWYVVTEGELAALCDYLDSEVAEIRDDAYSHWCADTSAEEQPSWWTPEQTVLTVVVGSVTHVHETYRDGVVLADVTDELDHYVDVSLTVAGRECAVTVAIGVPRGLQDSARRSGAGSSYAGCPRAWWVDPSDWTQLETDAVDVVLNALDTEAGRLWAETCAKVENDE